MTRWVFYSIIALLFLSGIALTFLRHASTGIPLLPGEQTRVWVVEARVSFIADGGAVEASLDIRMRCRSSGF